MTASAIFTPSTMWTLLGLGGARIRFPGVQRSVERCRSSIEAVGSARFRWPLPRTGPRRTQGRRSRALSVIVRTAGQTREGAAEAAPSTPLSAKAETLDELTVSSDVLLLQVLQEATTPADHQQQTTTAVVVVLVGLEVLGELIDALGENGHLHLGRTGVALGRGVLVHDLLLGGGVERHGSPSLSGYAVSSRSTRKPCVPTVIRVEG